MSEAFERVMDGLNEALAFAQGKDVGAVVHRIEVPTVDVAAIRASTGLSQSAFAQSIGVAKGTLLNWEHGPPPTDRPRASPAGHDRPTALAGAGVAEGGVSLGVCPRTVMT